MATDWLIYENRIRHLWENITKKPAFIVLSTPVNELGKKIDDEDVYCSVTRKKIEREGYYSNQTLKAYSTFELAQEYTNKDMEECGIKELRGKIIEKLLVKQFKEKRKNFWGK